jgi:hypothetical protein
MHRSAFRSVHQLEKFMGTRSDVGIAIRGDARCAFEKFLKESEEWADALPQQTPNDGVRHGAALYVFESVTWNNTIPVVVELLSLLEGCLSEDYLLVEACARYPGSGMATGDYHDNPFSLSTCTTEELYYE